MKNEKELKILLVEPNLMGHRTAYLDHILKMRGVEFYLYAPKNLDVEADKYFKSTFKNRKSFAEYLRWIQEINKIVRDLQIDIIHITDGDSIMRWLGDGLGNGMNSKLVITYHHFFPGLSRKISYRCMCKNGVAVVHTQAVQEALTKYGVRKVERIEYPAFSYEDYEKYDKEKCREKYGLPVDIPVIGIVGGMCKYKNILKFLDTMKECNEDFFLLIKGKTVDLTEKDILNAIEPYKNRVQYKFDVLSEEEFHESIVACDIVFCIYGKHFDGASGPLADGVCTEKFILGCSHGSLGQIINDYHLGLTAKCDDKDDILDKTKTAIKISKLFRYDEIALKYKAKLNPHKFINGYKEIYMKLNVGERKNAARTEAKDIVKCARD